MPIKTAAVSPQDTFQWDYGLPLINNRFLWADLLLAWAIVSSVMVLLVFIMSLVTGNPLDLEALALLAKAAALVTASLLLIGLLILTLLVRNRYPVRFTVSPRGVQVEVTDRKVKGVHRLAFILGLLARRPSAAGAGLLAMSQEAVFIPWDDGPRLTVHPAARVLTLRTWRVVRLYCTPANFPAVAAAVRAWCAQGAQRHAKARKAAAPGRRRLLFINLGCLAAALSLLALPVKLPRLLPAALVLAALLAVWLPPLGRFSALFIVGGAAAVLGLTGWHAWETSQLFTAAQVRQWFAAQGRPLDTVPNWVLFRYHRYEHWHADDWLGLAVALAGLAFFVWLALNTLRRSTKSP